MKEIINLIISKDQEGKRIDSVLSRLSKKISRTKIQNYILNGNMEINGIKEINPSKKLKNKDKVKLEIPEDEKIKLKPYDYKLKIIYEDDDLMVIDKDSGISMHPGAGNYNNTIVNALLKHIGNNLSNLGGYFRPGIVHRIDKNTSGLILVAKNNYSHEHLSNQFKNHSVGRIYLTLVWGKIRPRSGKIETLIKRSSKNRQLMEVGIIRGKKAITNYETIKIFEKSNIPTFSLVECKLDTGRTHQIRVHLSYKGNFILGDKQYKKKFKKLKNIDKNIEQAINNLNRQFLHAKYISFMHPKKNKLLEFYSNLPKELDFIIKSLRNA